MRRFLQQFNWRFLLVRILVNALALAVTAAMLPKVYFVNKSISNLLFMALTLGVLNALVKPILQALTVHFIVVTFGLVIVLVNVVVLLLLSLLFPERFAVDNLLWALVGGLILGLFGSFLESLLGLTVPIVSDELPGLRQGIEEKAARMSLPIKKDWQTPTTERAQNSETLAPKEAQIAPNPAGISTGQPATVAPTAHPGSIDSLASESGSSAPAEPPSATQQNEEDQT
jgi:putative membrane protein